VRPRVPSIPPSVGLGALASGPALLILVVARAVLGAPGLLEALSDGALRYVPLPVFDAGIATFGPAAKGGLSIGVALGIVAACAVLAPLALRWTAGLPAAGAGLVIAGIALLIVEVVVLPVAGEGLFGAGGGTDLVALQLPLILASLAYGLTLGGLAAACAPAGAGPREAMDAEAGPATDAVAGVVADAPVDPSRRHLLRRGLLALGGVSLFASLGAIGWRAASAAHVTGSAAAPTAPPADPFGPTPALTPVSAFYTVSKNLGSPSVDGMAWRLSVGGLVDTPFEVSLDELRSLTSTEAYRTLMCISDDIVAGDDYIGNQRWRGLPVSVLLDRAGVQDAARYVIWGAADDYAESLPLDVARDPDTWIVHEMGGKPLTADHGFPARILIADRFGMKGPKWITSITLSADDARGYWEQRGWDQEARVKILSRIDLPEAGDIVPAGTPFAVTGIAFAGDRGVSRVEVSPDDGRTWADARLEGAARAPLGPLTWVRFHADVAVPAAGRTNLVVRATEGTGALQVEEVAAPAPSGSTGWQRVLVVAE
jgi:DMSO/TMAO reductase YedYZ molybdopterin-dependent catalytic subunit